MYDISAKTGSVNKDVNITLCSSSVAQALWTGGKKQPRKLFMAVKSNFVCELIPAFKLLPSGFQAVHIWVLILVGNRDQMSLKVRAYCSPGAEEGTLRGSGLVTGRRDCRHCAAHWQRQHCGLEFLSNTRP